MSDIEKNKKQMAERLLAATELVELSIAMMSQNIKRAFPDQSDVFFS